MYSPLEQKILYGLNKQQLKATMFDLPHQSLMLLAGAGSGKTKTIVSHVAWLIVHDHVNPSKIVMLTFTHKAAEEMKTRLNDLLGDLAKGVWASTFHSFCMNHIIRPNAEKLGYTKNFTICGDSSQRTYIKHIMIKLNINTKQFKPRDVLNKIAGTEANVMTPADFNNVVHKHPHNPFTRVVNKVYPAYMKKLQRNNEMDFNELIFLSVELLQHYPRVQEKCENNFQYINVDEVQDNSFTQWRLLRLMTEKYNNLFSCGDDSQSIYSFRFARPDILIHFSKHFPNMHLIKMTRNYRSTKNILAVANNVIKHNKMQIPKNMYTDNPTGPKTVYYHAENAEDEAGFLIKAIKYDMQRYHLNYNDFAILYRQNAQSRVLEEVFLENNIPHIIYNDTSFFKRKEIMDIVAYLQALVNKRDNMALVRIINLPKRGIGDTTVTKLVTDCVKNNRPLLKSLEDVDHIDTLSTRTKNKVKQFTKMLLPLQTEAHRVSVKDITIKVLKDSGILPTLITKSAHSGSAEKRIKNLKEFVSFAEEFDAEHKNVYPVSIRLNHFLDKIQLLSAQDTKDSGHPQVKMMTIHAAKGLEFPVVFVVGCEEGLLPSGHAEGDPLGVEEERRLFYVATTRAEHKLYLTNAFQRTIYGSPQANPPSRFLKEIPKSLIHEVPSSAPNPDAHHGDRNSSADSFLKGFYQHGF